MDYAIQFVKNYNRNTKVTKITSTDGQERALTLSIDAVRNAFALDVVAEPYVDLRKVGNKLEGVTNYEIHKQHGGVRFINISPHLQKAARVLRLLIRVEPANHHNIIPANHLLRDYTNLSNIRPTGRITFIKSSIRFARSTITPFSTPCY